MELGIKGKRALVTGAGRGLGESIAIRLAQEGARVAIVSRTKTDLKELLTKMGGSRQGHYMIACDLTAKGAPGKVVAELKENFGNPDMLVNNLGGTLDITDPLCSIDDWQKVWRFNMGVAIELNLLVVPAMRKKHWGRIVHISSISSVENHGPVTYCAVKAALNAYVRSLGRFLAPDGIVVTAVLPGAVFTEGGYWDTASKERPEHVQKYLAERMAIQRFGKPDEISNVVAFLCSEHASFCIGSIVPVDGGQGRSYFGL